MLRGLVSPRAPVGARAAVVARPAAPRLAAARPVQPSRAVSLPPLAAVPGPVVAAATTEAEPEAVAKARFTRGSAHKLRRVLDTIRGRSYEEALMVLEFLPYRAAEPILATLISAASNAKNNLNLSKARLYVSEAYADQAGQLKRSRPRSKGRPFPILKPISHLTIKVKERAEEEAAPTAATPAEAVAE